MIPILYEANEEQFVTNGIGRLSDAISCTVRQEEDGLYQLQMRYPIDGIHADDIIVNRIIYAVPENGKRPQPLKIREVDKSLKNEIQVTARHRTYDLSYYVCMNFGRSDYVPYTDIPVLYNSSEQVVGALDDLIQYSVAVSSTNWVLTLTYPTSGAYNSSITTSAYIYAQPDIGRDMRLFDITAVSTSGNVKTVTASCPIQVDEPREYNQMTVSQALGYISQYTDSLQYCPFTFAVQPTTPNDAWATQIKEFWNEKPVSVRQLLIDESGDFHKLYGGEWEFDNYRCILHESRGSDNGVTYRYGKNIRDITERINIDDLYTHAFSYWKGTASSSTNTQEGEYFVKRGTVLRALDPQYSEMFPQNRIMIIDASTEFEYEPTVEELDEYTQQYIVNNSVGVPTVTIDVSVVDLSSTEDYKDIAALEHINLYDTVTVIFPEFGVDIKAKVTAIEYDVLLDRNNKITIGATETNLSDIIADNKKSIVTTANNLQKWADHMAERATEATSGWYGGNIRKNYDANDHKQQSMYIMNTDNVDTASRTIKADGNGIGISMNGPKGNYKPVINLATGMMYFGNCSWNLSTDVVYVEMYEGKCLHEFYVNGSTPVGYTLSDHEQRILALEQQIG